MSPSEITWSRWNVERTECVGRRGAVASKHVLGTRAGIEVLRDGGNAIDAAVATAFTVAVVEPFMSGIGGGGFMALYDARGGGTVVIDFGMISPRAAHQEMFPLLPGGGPTGYFGWDAVVDDANIVGHRAAAVPGAVAGLLLAHERFGRLPLARLLEPAIHYAENGVEVDWFTSYIIGTSLAELRRFPASRAVFTRDDRPLLPFMAGQGDRLVQRDLSATLRAIAAGGADAFYRGPIADAIHEDMARNGGLITRDDLAAYRPRIIAPGLIGRYRGCTLAGIPAPSGGPTVMEMLGIMDRFDLRSLGHNSAPALHIIAEAGLKAFGDRFAFLSDPASDRDDNAPGMVDVLLDDAYLDRVSSAIDPHGPRRVLPVPDAGRDRRERTTTTLATADEDGNLLALTTTVMSSFGSAVLVPGTGIVLNNGMMWFDPRPGRPNSVGPAKRPLNNMSPVIVLRDNKPFMAVGAMGGRRIIGAVVAIVSNVLDYGMGMQQACAAPRVDLSTERVLADPRIPPDVLNDLRSRGHDVTELEDTFGAFEYGSPAGILVDQGLLCTGVDPLNPAAAAAF